jgi:hypothetical protein
MLSSFTHVITCVISLGLGVVVHTYNPSYTRDEGKIVVQAHSGKRAKPYLKNKLKAKGLGASLSVEHL